MKMMIALLAVLLAGCAAQSDPDWMNAPTQYRCTMEQAKQVDLETRTCDSTGKWSGYQGTYCYGSAIMRNCEKVIGGQVLPKKANA